MAENIHAAAPVREPTGLHYGSIIGQGVIGGLLAGVVLTIYESLAAYILVQNIFGFLRLAGATVVGEQALTDVWAFTSEGLIGLVVIGAFSIVAGILFALIVGAVAPFHSSAGSIIISGLAFGFLMWLVIYYAVAPVFNWFWLIPNSSTFWQGFLGFTVFFGLPLGLYLARKGLYTVP